MDLSLDVMKALTLDPPQSGGAGKKKKKKKKGLKKIAKIAKALTALPNPLTVSPAGMLLKTTFDLLSRAQEKRGISERDELRIREEMKRAEDVTEALWRRFRQQDVRVPALISTEKIAAVAANDPRLAMIPPRGTALGALTPIAAGNADRQLAELQSRAMDRARHELTLGRNPGEYARAAGMIGGPWCGYFASFNLDRAARDAGGRFSGNHHLHSVQKAQAYFQYRNYVDNSAAENARLDGLRAQHQNEGSTRRFFTLEGTPAARGRTSDVYPPGTLPIRAGDVVMWGGHMGLVESYDPATARLVTIEGNAAGRVQRREYDLNDPAVRARIEGFGRPARGDMS